MISIGLEIIGISIKRTPFVHKKRVRFIESWPDIIRYKICMKLEVNADN